MQRTVSIAAALVLAAIRAMGNSDKRVFEGPLKELMEEQWTSADMRNEAAFALEKIRG